MSKEIIFEIGEDGEVEAKASGYTGDLCEKTIKAILKGMGKSTASGHTPEYYQRIAVKRTVRQ